MDSAGKAQGTNRGGTDGALRRIEGISRMDRVRNVDNRGRLKQEGVLDMVKKRQ